MPRHTQRLRRMTSRPEGAHEDLELARMERITDEEIEAELVEIAVQAGFDADLAARDPYSALTWIEEQLNAFIDAMPGERSVRCLNEALKPSCPRRRPGAGVSGSWMAGPARGCSLAPTAKKRDELPGTDEPPSGF